jgi:hypothetical protein
MFEDDEGAFKASAMYHDLKSLNELQDQFEKLGPLVFGFHDGQSEAPKIMSQRVNKMYQSFYSILETSYLFNLQIRDFYWGQELNLDNPKGLVDAISDSSYAHPIDTSAKIHAMKSQANVSKMSSRI